MRKELLFCSLTVLRPVGVQPQGDVGRLHRLSYHPDEIIAECVQPRGEARSHTADSLIFFSTITTPLYRVSISQALRQPLRVTWASSSKAEDPWSEILRIGVHSPRSIGSMLI